MTIGLALHLEATELMDPQRCATTADLLLTALAALRSDVTLKAEAERVCKLIYQELFSLDDLILPLEHFRLSRTMAPLSGQDLLSETELLKAVASHCDALRINSLIAGAAYVFE